MAAKLRGKWTMALGVLFVIVLLVIVFLPSVVAPQDPFKLDVRNRLQPPTSEHIFGTDEAGRDIFARVVHGSRYSLGMAFVIVLAAITVGITIGSIAGFAGGRVDELLMRLVDVFLSFPYFILAMAIASALGRGMTASIIALSIVWWPSYARLVRGMVLSIKENLFVSAAQALGTNNRRMIWWHILPHCSREINARATIDFGSVLLALTGLGFLGLGMQNPAPEWGLLVSNATSFVLSAWWYAFFPGLVLFLCVIAFAAIGDALSEGKSFGDASK